MYKFECRWEFQENYPYSDNYYDTDCGETYFPYENNKSDWFYFCPKCGRKIKEIRFDWIKSDYMLPYINEEVKVKYIYRALKKEMISTAILCKNPDGSDYYFRVTKDTSDLFHEKLEVIEWRKKSKNEL